MDELSAQSAPRLSFDVSRAGDGAPVVTLKGELDMATADELEKAVEAIIDSEPSRLVVDLTDLQFADSSAIALLVRWANLIHHVELREPPPLLRAVLQRMGLDQRLHVTP